MAWKDMLRLGVEHFKRCQYEEALEAFNQAIQENPNDKTLFDSRAAVLEKLSRPLDALKDSKKVIDLAPASWQGYMRSARLFLQIGKPSSSLKIADLGLERMKTTDGKRRVELEAVREQAVMALEPPPCFFSRLPVEIQVEVFTRVIDGSNAKMLALTLVCRSWREIIVNSPKFWRHLNLTDKTTLKKADTWLQRANGTLSTLHISPGVSLAGHSKALRTGSKVPWSSLDTLEISMANDNIHTILPPDAFENLRLRSLSISVPSSSAALSLALRNMDASRMNILVLKIKMMQMPLESLAFTCLTHLHLIGTFSHNDLFALLRHNPLLETLILSYSGPRLSDNPPELTDRIELSNLSRLELVPLCGPDVCLRAIRYPNLKVLRIDFALFSAGERCIKDILSQRVPCLEELNLYSCTFSSTDLIALLQSSSSLRNLRLASSINIMDDDICSVVEALAKTSTVDGDNGSATIYCPQLQHVDLSASKHLKTGAVIRLVKAHLSNASAPGNISESVPSSGHSQPLPILSLNIDDCPTIDADALPWLRAMVPHLSCKMKPVKMGKGRG